MRCCLVALNCRFSHSCLALFYVRGELARRLPGCETSLRAFTINDPYYEVLVWLAAEAADAYFFSAVVWNAAFLERLLADLVAIKPEARFVVGGPQAPTLAVPRDRVTVVGGPVEGLGAEFFCDLSTMELQPRYEAGPAAGHAFPYEAADFSTHLRHRDVLYEASRGCPFRCAYCLSSVTGPMTAKPLDMVKEELRRILDHAPPLIRFVDRTFNADPRRAMALWQFLAEQPESTSYHFEMAPDLITEEMLSFLETIPAGRFRFELGIQSTNPAALAAVNRRMDVAAALDTIRRLVALNRVHVHADLILGLPFETAETWAKTVREAAACLPHHLQMGLLKILPGTDLDRRREEYGLVASCAPPYPILATRWLGHEELAGFFWHGECLEAFCNPRYFRTFFEFLARGGRDLFQVVAELVPLCQGRGFFSLAKTQQVMCEILLDWTKSQPDGSVLAELLVMDWLLCGHRFLPAFLPAEDPVACRARLFRSLPERIPGLFDHQGRNEFFKTSMFCRFSASALTASAHFGTPAGPGVVAFLKETAPGVVPRQRAVLLPG